MSQIFIYLDLLGPLLALPFFLRNGRSRSRGHYILISFLVLQLLANGLAKVFMLMLLPNNIFIYQANSFFSCVLVGLYFLENFKQTFSPRSYNRTTIYLAVSCTLLLAIIIFEDTSYFNSLSYTFTGFTLCVFSVFYYLHSLLHVKDEDPVKTKSFWAVTAFFIYYSTSFFIFLYYRILTKLPQANFGVLWGIHNFVLFLTCLLLIKASKRT
ncbi:MAG: hypothetical protein ABIN67_22540 [Ferruginibacter sp.]